MSTQLDTETSRQLAIVNLFDDWSALCAQWDEYVHQHPKGSIFHSSEMIRVQAETKGHHPLPLAALNDSGQIVALVAAVRIQTLPRPMGPVSSRSIMFAEPLCNEDPDGVDALARLIERHDAKMRRRVLFSEVRPLFAPGAEREALERCGYRYLEYLNQIVDVSQPPDQLWEGVHKSTRRKIRLCERNGWNVRDVTGTPAVEPLYALLKQSYTRARVPLADRSLFDAAVRHLAPLGMLLLMATYEQETPLAMDALLLFKDRVYHWYSGVCRKTNLSPATILRWNEMRWASENGFTVFDTGGTGWPNVPYGVRAYKAQFGGEQVQFGRYRRIYAPWKLALAERAYELSRKVLFRK